MTDTVMVTMVTSVGALVLALANGMVSIVIARITHENGKKTDIVSRQTETVREQVQNSHFDTNLRDDIDTIKDALLGLHERLSHHTRHESGEHERMWRSINKIKDER